MAANQDNTIDRLPALYADQIAGAEQDVRDKLDGLDYSSLPADKDHAIVSKLNEVAELAEVKPAANGRPDFDEQH